MHALDKNDLSVNVGRVGQGEFVFVLIILYFRGVCCTSLIATVATFESDQHFKL